MKQVLFQISRAPALPCGSFEEKQPIVNEDEPRMDTNRHEDRWTSLNDKRRQNASATCALGVTRSWDEGFLGARASRPHQAWHSLAHLPHLDQPGTAPWLSFGLADGVLAHRVAACSIALKLSGGQRDRMRAGRPRSQGNHSPLEGESQKPSRQAKADAVGGWRAASQKADVHPLGNSRLPASRAPAPHGGADHSRVKQALFQVGGIGGRQCVPEGRYSSAAYAAHRWVIEVKFLLINFLH